MQMGEALAEVAPEEREDELSPQEIAELSGAREQTPVYGGQALMEGVMMRSPRFVAAAVRREDGEVVIKREALKGMSSLPKVLRLPLIRGVFALWDAFSVGLRYLTFSGDVLLEEAQQQESLTFAPDEVVFEDVGERGVRAIHRPTGVSCLTDRERDREGNRRRAERILRGKVARYRERQGEVGSVGETPVVKAAAGGMSLAMWGTMVVAFAIALVVFLWTPHAIAYWLTASVFGLFDPSLAEEAIPAGPNTVLNIIEGVIRLAFFFAYVLAIAQMPDIRRVFEYHGAEHATINCFEAGEAVTEENCLRYSRLHPRCGTAFLLVVIVVKIILGCFFGWPTPLIRSIIRLALLPVVAGIAYEVIRWAGRHRESLFSRILAAPGMLMQTLTTRKPEAAQIQVAIHALAAVACEFDLPSGWQIARRLPVPLSAQPKSE